MLLGYPNADCPATPTDCSTTTILGANSSNCIDSWDIRPSELERIFLAPYDGNFTAPIADANMGDLATWEGLIDNAATTGTFIRELYVTGSFPLPEKQTFQYKSNEITTSKKYTINADLIDVNDTNYSLSRDFDNNKLAWVAWSTDGGSLFGWALAKIDSDVELNSGQQSLETIKFVATYNAKCKPPRYQSPWS